MRPARQSPYLWQASGSLYSNVPWLSRQWGLPLVSGLFLCINLALIILLAIMGLYHFDYYTYWNFLIVTIFFAGMTAFYPFGGWPSALFTAIWAPITYGSAALVVLLIFIIVAVDDTVYVSGTAADPSTVDPKYSFRQIRSGDWVIHGLPLLELLVFLLFDFQIYYRALLYHWERSDKWIRRWWYWAYFYISPLLLMTLYSLIFDSQKKYTDKISPMAGFWISVGLDLVVMTVYALSLRTSEPKGVVLPDFYPDYLHPPPLASE